MIGGKQAQISRGLPGGPAGNAHGTAASRQPAPTGGEGMARPDDERQPEPLAAMLDEMPAHPGGPMPDAERRHADRLLFG